MSPGIEKRLGREVSEFAAESMSGLIMVSAGITPMIAYPKAYYNALQKNSENAANTLKMVQGEEFYKRFLNGDTSSQKAYIDSAEEDVKLAEAKIQEFVQSASAKKGYEQLYKNIGNVFGVLFRGEELPQGVTTLAKSDKRADETKVSEKKKDKDKISPGEEKTTFAKQQKEVEQELGAAEKEKRPIHQKLGLLGGIDGGIGGIGPGPGSGGGLGLGLGGGSPPPPEPKELKPLKMASAFSAPFNALNLAVGASQIIEEEALKNIPQDTKKTLDSLQENLVRSELSSIMLKRIILTFMVVLTISLMFAGSQRKGGTARGRVFAMLAVLMAGSMLSCMVGCGSSGGPGNGPKQETPPTSTHDPENQVETFNPDTRNIHRKVDKDGNIIEYLNENWNGQGYGRVVLYYDAQKNEYATYEWYEKEVVKTLYKGKYGVTGNEPLLSGVKAEEKQSTFIFDHNGDQVEMKLAKNNWILKTQHVLVENDPSAGDNIRGKEVTYYFLPEITYLYDSFEGPNGYGRVCCVDNHTDNWYANITFADQDNPQDYRRSAREVKVLRDDPVTGAVKDTLLADETYYTTGNLKTKYVPKETDPSAGDNIRGDEVTYHYENRTKDGKTYGRVVGIDNHTDNLKEELEYANQNADDDTRTGRKIKILENDPIIGAEKDTLMEKDEYHANGNVKRVRIFKKIADNSIVDCPEIIEYESTAFAGKDYGRVVLCYDELWKEYKVYVWDGALVTIKVHTGDYDAPEGSALLNDVQESEKEREYVYEHNGEQEDLDTNTNGWDLISQTEYENSNIVQIFTYYGNGNIQSQEVMSVPELDSEFYGLHVTYHFINETITDMNYGRVEKIINHADNWYYEITYLNGSNADDSRLQSKIKKDLNTNAELGWREEYYSNGNLKLTIDDDGNIHAYGNTGWSYGRTTLIYDASYLQYTTYEWTDTQATLTVYDGEYSIFSGVNDSEKVVTYVYDHQGETSNLNTYSNGWKLRSAVYPDGAQSEYYADETLKRSIDAQGNIKELDENGNIVLYAKVEENLYDTYVWDGAEVIVTTYEGNYSAVLGDALLVDVVEDEKTGVYRYYHNGEFTNLDVNANGWTFIETVDTFSAGPSAFQSVRSVSSFGTTGQQPKTLMKATPPQDLMQIAGTISERYADGNLKRLIDIAGNIKELDEQGRLVLYFDVEKGQYTIYNWGRDQVTVVEYNGIYSINMGDEVRKNVNPEEETAVYLYDHNGEQFNTNVNTNGWVSQGVYYPNTAIKRYFGLSPLEKFTRRMAWRALADQETMNLIGEKWTAETSWHDSLGLTAVTRAEDESLLVSADLKGQDASKSKGEIFCDLSQGTVDISNGKIIVTFQVPPKFAANQINGIQILVKDGQWRNQYARWTNVKQSGEWLTVELAPTTKGIDPQGWTDDNFDPSDIRRVGIKFAINDSSTDVVNTSAGDGYFKVKEINVVASNVSVPAPESKNPYKTDPTIVPAVSAQEFADNSGVSFYLSMYEKAVGVAGQSISACYDKVLALFKRLKVSSARVWLTIGSKNTSGIRYDDVTGMPLDFTNFDLAVQDVVKLVQIAKETNTKLILVLHNNDLAEHHKDVFVDPDKRAALIELDRQLLERVKSELGADWDNYVKAIEFMNEPDDANTFVYYTQEFVKAGNAMIRTLGKPVTLGPGKMENAEFWLLESMLKPGDIFQLHAYNNNKEQLLSDLRLNIGRLDVPEGVSVIYGEVQ
ncbi:MAG: hypothetical protein KJ864_01190, partial [Candidatus Omnitrophica bacterium]|nr:hypothetical protein [Candidatus Omnitrophota bacterium]